MPRRLVAFILAATSSLTLLSVTVGAQQAILLEIRPKAGDTLHMRLEQHAELTASTRIGETDSSLTSVSSMKVHSRAIVQRSDASGATVLSITDSVQLSSDQPQLPAAELERLRKALQGQQVRLRMTPDGAAEVISDPDALPADLQAFVAQMPATLPARRVAVGERWTQTMKLPGAARADLTGPLSLRATFRLDSLTNRGRIAWISMSGELTRTEGQALPGGGAYRTSGTLEGSLVVDRDRGWMTESTTVVSVRSVMEPPAGSDAPPMQVRMRITQRLRTLDKR